MSHPWPNRRQRDLKYFSETIYLKKIWLFLKLIHAIYYSDNLKACLILIMGHLWGTSDLMDLNINSGPINYIICSLCDIILLFR